ncbi:MAG: serine/threonine-protein phosphatase [Candidatus Parcubacteria bacterium]|nr:serine/threonine-protein phosphatase [Candidatus Parcubacteria bacterium]
MNMESLSNGTPSEELKPQNQTEEGKEKNPALKEAKRLMFDMMDGLNLLNGVIRYDLTPQMEEKRHTLSHLASELIDGFFMRGKTSPEDIKKAHDLYSQYNSYCNEAKKLGPRMVNEREYEAFHQNKGVAAIPEASDATRNSTEGNDMSVEEIVQSVDQIKAEGGLTLPYDNKEDLVDDLIESHHLAVNDGQKKMMKKYFEARFTIKQEEEWYKQFKSQHPFLAPIMKVINAFAISPEIISARYYGSKLQKMVNRGEFTAEQAEKLNLLSREIKNAERIDDEDQQQKNRSILEKSFGEQEKGNTDSGEKRQGILESFSSSVGENDPKEPGRINEDQVLDRGDKGVYAVFDGVGGQEQGDVASYVAKYALSKECDNMPENMSLEETERFIQNTITKISNNIFENNQIQKEKGLPGAMASTITLAVVWKDAKGEKKLVIGNLGDSRAYLRKQGKLEQMTTDDNYLRDHAKDDVRARKLQSILNNINSEEEINKLSGIDEKDSLLLLESFRNRNIIMKCLGMKENTTPEITVHDFPSGSELLLATDGLTDNLTDKEIEQNFGKELANMAIKRSQEGKGRAKPDDTTFITVKN